MIRIGATMLSDLDAIALRQWAFAAASATAVGNRLTLDQHLSVSEHIAAWAAGASTRADTSAAGAGQPPAGRGRDGSMAGAGDIIPYSSDKCAA